MTAMRLHRAGEPLERDTVDVPFPAPGQVLVEVVACGVCRTDLHIVDGELAANLPIVPGHEIVGRVADRGAGAARFALGDAVGIAWLASACGVCAHCRAGRENLCDTARFTGRDCDGGYAQYAVADERFCFPLPAGFDGPEAAPLLCAGFIGYRALRMAGDARRVGIYGFGAAGHLVAQIAIHEGREVYAFTRPGDERRAGVRARPGLPLGRRLDGGPSRAPRCRPPLRARGRAGARRTEGACNREPASCAPAST